MKAELFSLDATRAERARHVESSRDVAGPPGKLRAVLVAAGLAMIACAVVAAALWLAWMLAEIVS